jgi:hypothetical protein
MVRLLRRSRVLLILVFLHFLLFLLNHREVPRYLT